ncbi:probable LRR receptor-like serine/threonine-protein kinase At3g47570 [Cornus florida]|uniref:probable LRR receptor-like serine/threonine-protein kinase At3g47570 n=1 Tax=Cornus florida TaxID=4283 RepID=UPI00289D9BCC|nr:probable LRR receptor-like serine/threonine-protein kinase At3g47570 [Cornus florida]
MELSNFGLSISRSIFCIYIYVIVACCLSLMHASLPTIVATSRLGGNETDRLALLAFKAKITNDPLQVLSSWNGSIPFCQWHGVTSGRRHKRVTKLDLSFEKEIPPELVRVRRLQILGLNNNTISGRIPANLSACSNLYDLYLEFNNLVGPILVELGSLSKLRSIYVKHNNLTGILPHSFMNVSSLEILSAFGNNIGGRVPYALGQLTNIGIISLGSNRLYGTIPPSIFNLSSLTIFDVFQNKQIIGSLPSDIGITLPNIQFFSIGENKFTGSIPTSISNASNLEVLLLNVNNFAGQVPTMERLHKLNVINLGINYLGSGETEDFNFLSSLTNATNLRVFILDSNNLEECFPNPSATSHPSLNYLV